MNREDFITKTYQLATGEATAPSSDSEDYQKIIDLGNIFIQDWQNEPGVKWNSLYRRSTIGTVTATDTYALDTDLIREICSDNETDQGVYVAVGDVKYHYRLVKPNYLTSNAQQCARIADDLVFGDSFTSASPQFGGSVSVPYYTFADPLTTAGSLVPVDQPLWLCYMVAAEMVRNDYVKAGQYGNLVALASNVMSSMKANNDSAGSGFVNYGGYELPGETMSYR